MENSVTAIIFGVTNNIRATVYVHVCVRVRACVCEMMMIAFVINRGEIM